MDVVDFNGLDHVLHHRLRSDVDTPDGADMVEGLNNGRLRLSSTEETDDADNAAEFDGLEALLNRVGATHLNDVVHALAIGGKLARSLAPAGIGLVVDDMVGTKLLNFLLFLWRRRCCNDPSPSCLGEL